MYTMATIFFLRNLLFLLKLKSNLMDKWKNRALYFRPCVFVIYSKDQTERDVLSVFGYALIFSK